MVARGNIVHTVAMFTADSVPGPLNKPVVSWKIRAWRRRGLIFGARYKGRDYFPAFQFRLGEPKPIVQQFLDLDNPQTTGTRCSGLSARMCGWTEMLPPTKFLTWIRTRSLRRPATLMIKSVTNWRDFYTLVQDGRVVYTLDPEVFAHFVVNDLLELDAYARVPENTPSSDPERLEVQQFMRKSLRVIEELMVGFDLERALF